MEIYNMKKCIAILVAYLGIMAIAYLVYAPLPALHEMIELMTKSLSDDAFLDLIRNLREFKVNHPFMLIFIYANVSLAAQILWLPGSGVIDTIGGAVWGFYILPLICIIKFVGAVLLYCITSIKLRTFVNEFDFQSLNNHIAQVDENGMYIILLSLRICPYVSNWLLNILFPCFNIPFRLFIVSHFFGTLPYTFIYVQHGVMMEAEHTLVTFLTLQLVPTLVALHINTLFPKVASILIRARRNVNRLANRLDDVSDEEDG